MKKNYLDVSRRGEVIRLQPLPVVGRSCRIKHYLLQQRSLPVNNQRDDDIDDDDDDDDTWWVWDQLLSLGLVQMLSQLLTDVAEC